MNEIAKRLLLDKTCDRCMYNYKNDVGYCSLENIKGLRLERDRLVPKENTCEEWRPRFPNK